jgi:hypothetical protein
MERAARAYHARVQRLQIENGWKKMAVLPPKFLVSNVVASENRNTVSSDIMVTN